MEMVGESIAIAWAGFGIVIENQHETPEALEVWVSVPEHSYQIDAGGKEMAGEFLASRFKKKMADLGVKRLVVKFRVRAGEFWTREMRDKAELDIKKMLFGSQF